MIEQRHEVGLNDNVLLPRYSVEDVSKLKAGVVRHQLEVGQELGPSPFPSSSVPVGHASPRTPTQVRPKHQTIIVLRGLLFSPVLGEEIFIITLPPTPSDALSTLGKDTINRHTSKL